MLQQKTTVIDLNWLLSYSGILIPPVRRATVHEQRTNSVFTDSRFHSKAPIQGVCQSIQRKLSRQIVLLFRSISDNGFCPTDVSRKPQRYRNLLKSLASKVVSLRLSGEYVSQQFSQRQRKKRLANLSRFCTHTQSKKPANFTPTKTLASSWKIRSMPWTQPSSTCVYPCFHGHSFASTRVPSNCIRWWTWKAPYPRLYALQAVLCTKRPYLQPSLWRRPPFMSWTRGIRILQHYTIFQGSREDKAS